jgi:N-acetylmuramoyl-L-alanine amidase
MRSSLRWSAPWCALLGAIAICVEPLRAAVPPDSNLRQMLVPAGRYGRHIEFRLRPTYITIHSTQNMERTAFEHAAGMQRGAFRGRSKWNRTGYLTWHFTVDDRQAIQSLPFNIQGEHADHDGPGNRTSIAIEICEFRNSRRQRAAVHRAAKLTAWLCGEYRIPIDHVVPHYHWPQRHFHNHQKNCPRILLDRGRPGVRWRQFLKLVRSY